MIEREKITIAVRNVVEKNKLEKCFLPIIEEFFFRVADQCKWEEHDFKTAINEFGKVINITFSNMPKNIGAHTDYRCNNTISIHFNVNKLKRILKFDKCEIENFIKTAMHELGHAIQFKRKDSYITKNLYYLLYSGFRVSKINCKNQNFISTTSTMINEFAETINANRLQNGHIEDTKKRGYPEIQNAGKVVVSSLGITELELADLQYKSREEYEKFIACRLGLNSTKMYIDSFEEILDSIENFSGNMEQRRNFISQIESLQTLSKKIFEERFENITENSNDILGDLAKLSIDKENKDNALRMMFDEFNVKHSELKIDERNQYT